MLEEIKDDSLQQLRSKPIKSYCTVLGWLVWKLPHYEAKIQENGGRK